MDRLQGHTCKCKEDGECECRGRQRSALEPLAAKSDTTSEKCNGIHDVQAQPRQLASSDRPLKIPEPLAGSLIVGASNIYTFALNLCDLNGYKLRHRYGLSLGMTATAFREAVTPLLGRHPEILRTVLDQVGTSRSI